MKILRICLIGLLALPLYAVPALADNPYQALYQQLGITPPQANVEIPDTANAVQSEALQALNRYRQAMNLPAYTADPSLQKAAQAHADYIVQFPDDGHSEVVGKPGFTGQSAADRAQTFGFPTDYVSENISYQDLNGQQGIDELMDAPYHRLNIMDPSTTHVGTGYNSNGDLVVDFGDNRDPEPLYRQVVTYPYDGQTDAKNSWIVGEYPNPLRFWPDAPQDVGYPILFSYFSDHYGDTVHFQSETLTDSHGHPVPTYNVTPDLDASEGTNFVMLIPKTPLTPGESYTAKVSAYADTSDSGRMDLSKRWSFTTEKNIQVANVFFANSNSDGYNFLYVNLAGGQDPKADIRLSKDGSLLQEILPDGSYQGSGDLNDYPDGTYTLTVASPLFGQKAVIPVTIKRKTQLRYATDSYLQVNVQSSGMVLGKLAGASAPDAGTSASPPQAGNAGGGGASEGGASGTGTGGSAQNTQSVTLTGGKLIGGSTYLPLRTLFEALNANVDWNGGTQTVTAAESGTAIKLTVGGTRADLNGRSVALDAPVRLVDGSTYVPVRFVGTAFGLQVQWDAADQAAVLSRGGQTFTIYVK